MVQVSNGWSYLEDSEWRGFFNSSGKVSGINFKSKNAINMLKGIGIRANRHSFKV